MNGILVILGLVVLFLLIALIVTALDKWEMKRERERQIRLNQDFDARIQRVVSKMLEDGFSDSPHVVDVGYEDVSNTKFME